jgi:hypothetical protein
MNLSGKLVWRATGISAGTQRCRAFQYEKLCFFNALFDCDAFGKVLPIMPS